MIYNEDSSVNRKFRNWWFAVIFSLFVAFMHPSLYNFFLLIGGLLIFSLASSIIFSRKSILYGIIAGIANVVLLYLAFIPYFLGILIALWQNGESGNFGELLLLWGLLSSFFVPFVIVISSLGAVISYFVRR